MLGLDQRNGSESATPKAVYCVTSIILSLLRRYEYIIAAGRQSLERVKKIFIIVLLHIVYYIVYLFTIMNMPIVLG